MDEQQQHTWRENPEEKTLPSKHWTPLEIKKRRFLNSVRTKYPKKCVTMKAAMLDDLLSKFVARKNKNPHDDSCKERIKDRLNCVQKSETKPHYYKKLQNAAVLLKEDDNKISELVTQIKSSKFKITMDPNTDFNIQHGVSTMTCFEKTPREASVDIDDGSSLDSRPDMTEKLENVSIYCDSYHINNSTHNIAPCMDFVGKTMSLDIDANIPEGSQLSVIEPQSLIDLSRRFRE